jgi:hypothetical protein
MAKDHKQAAKSTAPVSEPGEPDIDLDANRAAFEAMEGEEVQGSGFPPYLKPVVGGLYTFMHVMTDARNPKFIRHNVIHKGKTSIICATGPVDDSEPVEVQPNEMYSISDYKGIPFEDLIGLTVTAWCYETKKLGPASDGTARAPMYMFKFKLSTAEAKIFAANKSQRGLAQAAATARALEAHRENAVNGLPITPSSHTPAPRQSSLGGA